MASSSRLISSSSRRVLEASTSMAGKMRFSEKRIFPAIDVDASSTRREELLMSREELAIVWKLRRVIGGLDNLQGLEMLLDRLRKTQSNGEFLMAITKSVPA